jgi:16S rRNA (cytidine1402-2'-O)-methyltransferase
VADPGFALARAAMAAGHAVTAAPGPSALHGALAVAGLPTDRFQFAGFLPPRDAARRRALETVAQVPATLVFYEAPHRLGAALVAMAAALGPARPAAVCRELTKRFEEVRRGTLAELAGHYRAGPDPRGEIVVVVGAPEPVDVGEDALDAALRAALAGASVRDAAAAVAGNLGLPRRRVYARALILSGGR